MAIVAVKTTREKLEGCVDGPRADRKPFEADWEEIGRLSLPRRVEINGTNNPGKRRSNTKLHDTGGLIAGRRLTNGLATGLSSASRPWFKLATRDRDMMEFGPVKEWLNYVEQQLYMFFAATNYYDATKIQYGDLGHLGVGVTLALEHPDYLGVYHALPVGTYFIGVDAGLRPSTLVREARPTVKELVEQVRDWTKLTAQVKTHYDKAEYHVRVPIIHVIEPNEDAYGKPLSEDIKKPIRSIKWEVGQNDKKILLSEKGFDSQPFTAPRWEIYGDTAYSDSSPGFQALPDLRELQLTARSKMRAKDGVVKPPMGAPANLSRTGLSFDPGTVTYFEAMAQNKPEPLFTIPYQSLGAIREDQMYIDKRVNELFYADLFMAITDMEGVQPRNEQELLFRNEEKLTQLGPVVDRVNVEKLEYDIDRAFTIIKNLGLIPPPPRELAGQPLLVDFISILAQAQKASSNTAIERLARFVGFLAAQFPESVLKFDAEQAIDEYAINTGTTPKIIRTDEMVASIKAEMQAQKARESAMAAAPAIESGAGAAKLLSETRVDAEGTSALQRVLGQ